MSKPLTQEQRIRLLDAIKSTLLLVSPQELEASNRSRTGGLTRIGEHLDALVDIVRRSTANQIEAYLWQVLEEVCDQCPNQNASCHCPLRRRDLCILYSSIPAIVETIAGELVAMKDEEYLRTHPQWLLNRDLFWSQR